jgi:hypothetical protein
LVDGSAAAGRAPKIKLENAAGMNLAGGPAEKLRVRVAVGLHMLVYQLPGLRVSRPQRRTAYAIFI